MAWWGGVVLVGGMCGGAVYHSRGKRLVWGGRNKEKKKRALGGMRAELYVLPDRPAVMDVQKVEPWAAHDP